jgi:alpha-tubulin suppressor-like RCC1 family protein
MTLYRNGQLGNNDTRLQQQIIPVAVATNGVLSGKNVIQVAAGSDHSLTLTSDGGVYSFGSNV